MESEKQKRKKKKNTFPASKKEKKKKNAQTLKIVTPKQIKRNHPTIFPSRKIYLRFKKEKYLAEGGRRGRFARNSVINGPSCSRNVFLFAEFDELDNRSIRLSRN